MIGYSNNLRNANYNLMNSRLGYSDCQEPLSEQLIPEHYIYDENDTYHASLDPNISAVGDMRARLMQHGGAAQQERMIYDKRRSLDRALLYSYQGANIVKIGDKEKRVIRALINPNKTKQDYDDKIISVGFESDLRAGDVFEWQGTHSHWLIYLQDLTELAYFRGDIRRCSYEVNWEDEDGFHSSWLAVQGPVETKIDYIQKHSISVDNPNYSLDILMPLTDAALKYFKRYAKFYLQGLDVCWRVEATDFISTPGILNVKAVEYYANEIEDDIEKGLVGALIVSPENPNDTKTDTTIVGETFIKPKVVYQYTYKGFSGNRWVVDSKYPVRLNVNPKDDRQVKLIWDSPYSGQFELTCGEITKTIVVESLF
jgi:hypothetical protein